MSKAEKGGLGKMLSKESVWIGLFAFFVVAGCLTIGLLAERRGDAVAGIVNVVVLAVLVSVTYWYAKQTNAIAEATRRQADASMQMAEEMKAARFAALRPIIAIRWVGSRPGKEISISFTNIGSGPGLNLSFYLTHPKCRFEFKHDRYTVIGVGEKYRIDFPAESFDFKDWAGLGINCDYQDVYNQHFRSILSHESEQQRLLVVSELKEG
jgi:hypothetical protein